jgi:hypothetical protein
LRRLVASRVHPLRHVGPRRRSAVTAHLRHLGNSATLRRIHQPCVQVRPKEARSGCASRPRGHTTSPARSAPRSERNQSWTRRPSGPSFPTSRRRTLRQAVRRMSFPCRADPPPSVVRQPPPDVAETHRHRRLVRTRPLDDDLGVAPPRVRCVGTRPGTAERQHARFPPAAPRSWPAAPEPSRMGRMPRFAADAADDRSAPLARLPRQPLSPAFLALTFSDRPRQDPAATHDT